MIRKGNFDPELQELARFARVISHPSRVIGTEEFILAEFRRVRDEIKSRL